MTAPDRSAEVAAWVNSHKFLFVGDDDPDDIRREILIPLAHHLNGIEGREVWGRLVKTDRNPPFIPHDILMWKDTREHFDVFTGAEDIEDTQPTWGYNPAPDDPRWMWQSVGGGTPDPTDPPPVDPPDPAPEDPALEARVTHLEEVTADLNRRLEETNEELRNLRAFVLALPPPYTLPPLVAEGKTSNVWGHQHTVKLLVKPA